jgi:hypothetical protein
MAMGMLVSCVAGCWFRGLTTLKEFKDIFCKFKYLQNYMAMAMNHGCMHKFTQCNASKKQLQKMPACIASAPPV